MSTAPVITSDTSTKKQSPWLDHVKAWRTSNPGVSYKDSLKMAKETYTAKPKQEKKDRSQYKANPWMEHINKFKDDNPDWKNKYTYKQLLLYCKNTYKKTNM